MEFITDYRTERYALGARWEQFPEIVKEHALMSSLDIMMALILGSYGKQFAAGEKLAMMMGMKGEIPVVGSDKTYNLLGAPIIDAMIVIGGAFHEKSFFKETKYNLDYLGIGHMTKEQLRDYLYTGKYTEKA